MKFRKILAGALAAVVAVGTLSISSFAADGDRGAYGDFEYVEYDGTLTITKYIGSDEVVSIPSDINGIPVTVITPYTFYGCDTVTTVEIPDSVRNIPDSLGELSIYPFDNCPSLTTIKVSDGNQNYTSVDGILYSKDMTTLIRYPMGKGGAYTIPDGVTSIEVHAFDGCAFVTSIDIPASVSSFNRSLLTDNREQFYHCDSLEAFNVDEQNERYKSVDGVLYYNDFLLGEEYTRLIYPRGKKDSTYVLPTEVSPYTDSFLNCVYLTYVDVEKGNEKYTSVDGVLYRLETEYPCSGELFYYPSGKEETEFTIPDFVTGIGNYAFNYCDSLTTVIIPESFEYAWGDSFYKCPNLTSVVIPTITNDIKIFYGLPFVNCSDDLTIYGYTDSYAEEFAKQCGINFVALDTDTTIADEETNIEISATVETLFGLTLTVTANAENQTDTRVDYDITLTDSNGNPAQPNGDVTVKIPVPEDWETDNIKVYRAEADGKYTDMKAEYSDGCMVFTTDHFSTYILTTVDMSGSGSENGSENENENENNNGNNDSSTGNTIIVTAVSTETAPTTTEAPAATSAPTTTAPAADTTAPATTAPNANADGSGADKNVNTGATLLLLPAIAAAAGVVISKKRK